jgi:hypothetical protein
LLYVQHQATRLRHFNAKHSFFSVCAALGMVADLPSKAGIREAVLGAAQATVELLLAQHKREEQGRWEVRVVWPAGEVGTGGDGCGCSAAAQLSACYWLIAS